MYRDSAVYFTYHSIPPELWKAMENIGLHVSHLLYSLPSWKYCATTVPACPFALNPIQGVPGSSHARVVRKLTEKTKESAQKQKHINGESI